MDDLFTLLARADELNVCSQLPTFVAAVPDKMPYMKPEDLDMCTVMNKVMQLESLVIYHDSVIKKCESTLSAAEHSPMQKNQQLEPRSGDAGADAADTGLMERAEWAEPGSMTDSY